MTPSVSVVMPAYNAARYVAAALDSVLAQTYRDFELIFVDDGSDDGTREVAQRYSTRITYVRQENRGEAAARNVGIERARGEFIAFLDADDMWLPEKLELQVTRLRHHGAHALVFSDLKRVDSEGRVTDEHVLRTQYGSLPEGDIFPYLFQDSVIASITAVVRRECFERVGFFDETLPIGCDYDMWLRLGWRFEVGYVDRPLAMYRQHGSNVTRNEALGYECQRRVLTRFVDLHPRLRERVGWAAVRRRLSMPSFALGRQSLLSGDRLEARRNLGTALKLWPWSARYWAVFLATFLDQRRRDALQDLQRKWRGAH